MGAKLKKIKKIISFICCFVFVFCSCFSNISFAVESNNVAVESKAEQTIPRYNYKISFETNDELGAGYGYMGGEKQTPKPPKPKKEFTEDGKYGRAIMITYHGFHIINSADRWGGVYYSPMQPVITLNEGLEPIPLHDYMKEVQIVAFWAKAPYSPYLGNKQRQFDIRIQTNAGTYSANAFIDNTGEWQYIKIPMANFRDSKRGYIVDNYDEITEFTALLVGIPYGEKYFGRSPDESTYNDPWIEPLYIDEILFDRSTPDNPAITLPSLGEEEYFSDAELVDILVEGKSVPYFEQQKNNEVIHVEMPNYYTAQDIKDVVGVPRSPSTMGSKTEQIKTGATTQFIPPAEFPGQGSLIVTAGDRITKKTYVLNFIKRYPLQVQKDQILGIDIEGQLTSGYKNILIPIHNEGEVNLSASIIAAVSEIETGKVQSVDFSTVSNIKPGQTESFNLQVIVPGESQNYNLSFYIWDGIDSMNSIADSIIVGQPSKMEDSADAIKNSRVNINPETGKIIIKGKNSNYSRNRKATLLVLKPEKTVDNLLNGMNPAEVILKVDEAAFDSDGICIFGYYMDDQPTGTYTARTNLDGAVIEEKFFFGNPQEVKDGIKAFNEMAEDADEESMFDLFNQYKNVFALSLELYDWLGEESLYQLNVLKQVMAVDTYATLQDIVSVFNKAVVLQALNKSESSTDVQNLLDNYNNILGFDISSKLYTKNLSHRSQRESVNKKISELTFDDLETARLIFKKLVLLQAINDVISYGEIYELLSDEQNAELFDEEIDFTDYNSLKDKTVVDKKMADYTFNDLTEVVETFYKFVKAQKEIENSGSGNKNDNKKSPTRGSNTSVKTNIVIDSIPDNTPILPIHDKKSRFIDMDSVLWAQAAVDKLAELNIVSGRNEQIFAPNEYVTREEFVKMLYMASGKELLTDGQCVFSDVCTGAWYYDYIVSAVKNGFVQGKSDGTFGVGEKITRQDAAVMVARVMKQLGIAIEEEMHESFDDDSVIDEYAKDSVYTIRRIGIINGVGNNMFAPKNFATRAEAAKIIYDFYSYINGLPEGGK